MLIEMVTLSLTVLTSLPVLTAQAMPPQEPVALTSSVPEKKLIAMLTPKGDQEAFSDNTIPEAQIVAMLAEPTPLLEPNANDSLAQNTDQLPIETETPQPKADRPLAETPTPTPIPPTEAPTPTPTATPAPQPITTAPTDLDSLFSRYSDEYHIDRELLKRIAACESGFNTTSHNTAHGYAGMYQFAESSWTAVRTRMGADTNPELRFLAEESIRTAAYHIANGGRGAWPSCG
jgi:soluble lytic murein transglycosylase-like protein